MSQSRSTNRTTPRGRARTQTLGREVSQARRSDFEIMDDPGYLHVSPSQPGCEVFVRDVGPDDEGVHDPDDEDDLIESAQAPDEPDGEPSPRTLTLSAVIGSRSPRLLLRLVRDGEKVRVERTGSIGSDLVESLEELRLFVQHRFDAGPEILGGTDWERLLDPQTPLDVRLLLLTRLAIRGQTRITVPGRADFEPNDRGLERYAGKFAALPDGLAFSLRWLLEDGQGRKKREAGTQGQNSREPSFNQLPDAVQLRALQAALAREHQERTACTDEEFAGRLADALDEMGIVLDRRTGITYDHVVGLRAKLKYHGLMAIFPNGRERQRGYDKAAQQGSEG